MQYYLVLVELVKGLGLDFLEGVVSIGRQVQRFVDLGVLLSRT
jgi:hypothetical protein